jgi:hypothetical protein
MATAQFSQLPKFPSSRSANAAKFIQDFQTQKECIERAGLRPFLEKLPGYETLSYKFGRTFLIDGMRLTYPAVVYIGHAKGGPLYACPDGNVIRAAMTPEGRSAFWKYKDALGSNMAPCSETPEPFANCPALRAGLTTPMTQEAQALIRYYISLRGVNTDLFKFGLQIADVKHLEHAVRLLYPEAAVLNKQSVFELDKQHVPEPDKQSTSELNKQSASEFVRQSMRDLQAEPGHLIGVATSSEDSQSTQFTQFTHSTQSTQSTQSSQSTQPTQSTFVGTPEEERMDWLSTVPTNGDPSQSGGADKDSLTRSYDSDSGDVGQSQGDSAQPLSVFVSRSHSPSVIAQEIRDLNELLKRKAYIQSQVRARRHLADYKDFEARKVMRLEPHCKTDIEHCMDEAAKIRRLASLDEREIESIDLLLARAMGGTVPLEPPQLSNIAHLTADGVKGITQAEQESRMPRAFSYG